MFSVEVKKATLVQRRFNVVYPSWSENNVDSTLFSVVVRKTTLFSVVKTTSVFRRRRDFHFQPYFNVVSTLGCDGTQRCFNVETTLVCSLGIVSRGLFASQIYCNKLWFQGPEFLKISSHHWPNLLAGDNFKYSIEREEKVKPTIQANDNSIMIHVKPIIQASENLTKTNVTPIIQASENLNKTHVTPIIQASENLNKTHVMPIIQASESYLVEDYQDGFSISEAININQTCCVVNISKDDTHESNCLLVYDSDDGPCLSAIIDIDKFSSISRLYRVTAIFDFDLGHI